MIETDINKRWEAGTDHHPKSKELFKALCFIDFKWGDGCFYWKSGGDGDDGEHLMYEMDIFFECQDAGVNYALVDSTCRPKGEVNHG